MFRVLLYALPILLAVYALIDCIQTDESEIRGLPKVAWIVLIVLIGIVGPIAWLVAGRNRSGRSLLPRLPLPGGRAGGRSRPLAPDDDPDFLEQIRSHDSYDRQLEEWEEELRRGTSDDPDSPSDGESPDDGPDGDVPAR